MIIKALCSLACWTIGILASSVTITQDDTNTANYVIPFNARQPDLWGLYKIVEASFWTAEEVDFVNDRRDFECCDVNYVASHLAYLAVAPNVINESFMARFITEIRLVEARCFYGFQITMRHVHAETFSIACHTFIKDSQHAEAFLQTTRKSDWILQWASAEFSLEDRLVASAAADAIFLASSTATFSWMKSRRIFPGSSFAHELMSRDVERNVQFVSTLFAKQIITPPTQERATEIISQAVAIERDFIKDFSFSSEIMTSQNLQQYIEFVAAELLVALGYPSNCQITNPFKAIDAIPMFRDHQASGSNMMPLMHINHQTSESSKMPLTDTVFDSADF